MDHEAVLPDRVREPGSVLVIRLPIQNEVRSLQNYRRYVLESIAQGILVLGKDVTYCVEQLGWMPPVVLGEEPPVPEDHPLLHAKNLIATPHVAFATKEALIKRAIIDFDNVRKYLDGTPQNVM